jgi:hypothetical protein
MYDEFNFTIENISSFTAHVIENQTSKSALVNNYLDTQSPVKKKQLFSRIVLPIEDEEVRPRETLSARVKREREENRK